MRSLFGVDLHQILNGYNGQPDRVQYLRALYKHQLHERARFDYVQSFGMINNTGNIGYYLFHGTRHPQGVKLMKVYVFGNRVAGSSLDRVYQGKREPDHRTSE